MKVLRKILSVEENFAYSDYIKYIFNYCVVCNFTIYFDILTIKTMIKEFNNLHSVASINTCNIKSVKS